MNTGLHDVWNLVWKLDLVVHGHGNEQLLDSYNAERRPVIKQVIDTTHFLTKALGTPSKLAQLLRDTVIPMVSRPGEQNVRPSVKTVLWAVPSAACARTWGSGRTSGIAGA